MRTAILKLLKSQEEISGEYISDQLHISRAAVAKHIKALRAAGYIIEASPKKGYRLISIPNILSEAEIVPLLTEPEIWHINCFDELDSTSIFLRKQAELGAPDHSIVIAEHQNCGMGRLQRSWYTQPLTNLHTSILLRPRFTPQIAQTINLMAAVAIAEALQQFDFPCYIKWPNDILSLSGKKLCGIKSEMRCDLDIIEWLIVGIGININSDSFPEELQNIAGSLYLESGKIFSRSLVAAAVFNNFHHYYQLLCNEGFASIRQIWLKYAISINKQVRISTITDQYYGIARDIDQEGYLILEKDGQLQKITAGDMII